MKKIVVFCGSSLGFNPVYKNAAIALGNYFADNNIELVYGGGKIGMMGILADAILEKGGVVTGIIPKLLQKEEVLHPKVKQMHITKTMSERKVLMSKMVDAYITLPGGLGTLDELFEALTINQLFIEQKPVAILNVNGFFDATLLQLDKMVEEGYLKPENRKLLIESTTVEDLMQKILDYQPQKIVSIIHKVVL
ncbi:UNVERIFIED_CONTAM: hypothetical protein GTU68_055332 [Idotea baltica]|nr:hypothetical protein [Idotea baltica]